MKKALSLTFAVVAGLAFVTTAHAIAGVAPGVAGPASGNGPVAVSASNTDTVSRTDTVVVHWSRGVDVNSTDSRCVLGSYSHRSGKLTVTDPELRCALTLAPGATASLASGSAASPTTALSITAATTAGTAIYYFNPGTPAAVVPGDVLVYGDLAVGHQATVKLYVSNTGTLASSAGSATLSVGPQNYNVSVPAISGGASQQYIADVTITPSTAGNQAMTFTTTGGSTSKTVTVLSGLANLTIGTTQPGSVTHGSVLTRTVKINNVGDGSTTGYVLVSESLDQLTFVSAGSECREQITYSGTANNPVAQHSVQCTINPTISAGQSYTLSYTLRAPSAAASVTSTVSITGLAGSGSVSVPSATSTITVS